MLDSLVSAAKHTARYLSPEGSHPKGLRKGSNSLSPDSKLSVIVNRMYFRHNCESFYIVGEFLCEWSGD